MPTILQTELHSSARLLQARASGQVRRIDIVHRWRHAHHNPWRFKRVLASTALMMGIKIPPLNILPAFSSIYLLSLWLLTCHVGLWCGLGRLISWYFSRWVCLQELIAELERALGDFKRAYTSCWDVFHACTSRACLVNDEPTTAAETLTRVVVRWVVRSRPGLREDLSIVPTATTPVRVTKVLKHAKGYLLLLFLDLHRQPLEQGMQFGKTLN